jgi:hypothetical protein
MDIATIVGSASLLTAVGFGLYQYRKQKESDRQRRKVEHRLQRKENLEELSKNLQALHDRTTTLSEHIIHPRTNEDMDLALYDLSGDVLSYAHANNENPVVSVDELEFRHPNEERNRILNEEVEVVDAYNKTVGNGYVSIFIHIEQSRDHLRYSTRRSISGGLRGISFVHEQLQTIRNGHVDILDQFDSSLIEDTVNALNQLTTACFKQIFESYDGVEFDLDDYETPTELEDAIYSEFLLSEEVHTAIDDLEEVSERIDEIQKAVISTSYS